MFVPKRDPSEYYPGSQEDSQEDSQEGSFFENAKYMIKGIGTYPREGDTDTKTTSDKIMENLYYLKLPLRNHSDQMMVFDKIRKEKIFDQSYYTPIRSLQFQINQEELYVFKENGSNNKLIVFFYRRETHNVEMYEIKLKENSRELEAVFRNNLPYKLSDDEVDRTGTIDFGKAFGDGYKDVSLYKYNPNIGTSTVLMRAIRKPNQNNPFSNPAVFKNVAMFGFESVEEETKKLVNKIADESRANGKLSLLIEEKEEDKTFVKKTRTDSETNAAQRTHEYNENAAKTQKRELRTAAALNRFQPTTEEGSSILGKRKGGSKTKRRKTNKRRKSNKRKTIKRRKSNKNKSKRRK